MVALSPDYRGYPNFAEIPDKPQASPGEGMGSKPGEGLGSSPDRHLTFRMRRTALDASLRIDNGHEDSDQIVDRAETFYQFLSKSDCS